VVVVAVVLLPCVARAQTPAPTPTEPAPPPTRVERIHVALSAGGGLYGWAHGAMSQLPVLPDARVAGGMAGVNFTYRRRIDDDEHWLVVRADAAVRIGSEEALAGGRSVLVAYARVVPTVGVETRHARFAAGFYLGNGGDSRTDAVAWPALSGGVGDRDVFMLHVDLLSQPGCFAGQCLVGASVTTPLAWGELRFGVSFASDKSWRMFAQVPVTLAGARFFALAEGGAVRELPTFGVALGAVLGD
jgi:hypothetical protein